MKKQHQNLMDSRPICPILDKYYKRKNRHKESQLETGAARYLFSRLSPCVATMLREGFLAGESGDKIPGWSDVVEYFQKNSEIIPALTANPGTFSMLERMYHFQPVIGEIDNYFLMTIAGGQALRNRYDIVNNYCVAILSKMLQKQERCLMVDIGSGPGRNGIEVTLRNPEFQSRLTVDCIEIDQEAIEKGTMLVLENLLCNVSFVRENMIRLNGRYRGKVDFGLNVGVVCGLPYRDRVRLLKNQLSWFRPGGILIVAGLTEKMAQDDLLCAYILRETTGWNLQFRPVGELKQSAMEAGWKHLETFHDWPTRLYDIEVLEA
jgi:SAM-dependent methyltransferase